MPERVTVTFDGRDVAYGLQCFLRVAFLNRPYPDADEPWDREVINCEVSVDAGAFKGQYETAIWAHELVIIRAVLSALYDRVGQEAELYIDLLSLGHLTLEVVAHGHPGMGPDLHFSLEADQSYLPLWIKQADAVLATFPQEIPVSLHDPLTYRGRWRAPDSTDDTQAGPHKDA